MAQKKAKSAPTVEKGKGLDVGTAFIVCAEQHGEKIAFRTQRDAFFDIEHSDFTKQMLVNSKVNYIEKDDRLYVVGSEAMEFANIFHAEVRRPLRKGVISPSEKEALPMVELIIRGVAGKPAYEREIIYFSIPGPAVDADFNLVYHQKTLEGMLTRLGYTAKTINEGLAVIFSELAKEGFTGMGLSFGSGMVNVCLSYMSVPILTFCVTKAGDWIDQQVAAAVGETASRICAIKESSLDLTKRDGLSRIEAALSIYHDNLIEYVLAHIVREFEGSEKAPTLDKPIVIVLSGGSTMPKGFLQRFNDVLARTKFPLAVGEVRMASQPLYSVAKGALIAATADEAKMADSR